MNALILFILLHSLFPPPVEQPGAAIPRMEDVLADDQIFRNHYVLMAWDKACIRGRGVEMHLYALADEKEAWQEGSDLAERVVVVTVESGAGVQLPMEGHSDEIEWHILKTPEPLLGLDDSNGGNCFNCEFLHIVSFADWGRPKVVGRATDISDEDGDGWDDLMTHDDHFEMFCFCHAECPSIRIFWQLKGEKLMPSVEPYRATYENLLIGIDARIQGFMSLKPGEIPDGQEGHLWLILQEFLLRRIISPATAWDTLHKRLTVFDGKTFYRAGSPCEIAEIEAGILERLSA
jgi:hypothetical protein